MKRTLIKHKKKTFLCLILILVFILFFFLPKVFSVHYVSSQEESLFQLLTKTGSVKKVFVPSYISTPEPVKGIYMTSWTASSKDLRGALVKLIEDTELNTVVIDIKD